MVICGWWDQRIIFLFYTVVLHIFWNNIANSWKKIKDVITEVMKVACAQMCKTQLSTVSKIPSSSRSSFFHCSCRYGISDFSGLKWPPLDNDFVFGLSITTGVLLLPLHSKQTAGFRGSWHVVRSVARFYAAFKVGGMSCHLRVTWLSLRLLVAQGLPGKAIWSVVWKIHHAALC